MKKQSIILLLQSDLQGTSYQTMNPFRRRRSLDFFDVNG